jgi:hypothetical protein
MYQFFHAFSVAQAVGQVGFRGQDNTLNQPKLALHARKSAASAVKVDWLRADQPLLQQLLNIALGNRAGCSLRDLFGGVGIEIAVRPDLLVNPLRHDFPSSLSHARNLAESINEDLRRGTTRLSLDSGKRENWKSWLDTLTARLDFGGPRLIPRSTLDLN